MRRFLSWLCATVIRAVACTLRTRVHDRARIFNRADHPPVIMAFWHNRTALMAYYYQRYCSSRPVVTFITRSRDGQFITDAAARFGINAVRGSSPRGGGTAALTAIRAAEDQAIDVVITPDGPRGPRYEVQPGVLRLAQATGRPIVAVTFHLAWKRELRSWDRFQIPLPFSVCRLVTSEPIPVPAEASEADLAFLRQKLQAALGED